MPRVFPLLGVLCGLVACTPAHRYVTFPTLLEATREQVELRAAAAGVDTQRRGDDLVYGENVTTMEYFPMGPDGVTPPPREVTTFAPRGTLRFYAHDTGTRVEEVTDSETGPAFLLGSDARLIRSRWDPWTDRIAFELLMSGGAGRDPSEADTAGRLDFTMRLSTRLTGLHADTPLDESPHARWGLWLGVGPGVTFGPGGAAFRPELVLSLDRQERVSMVPGRALTVGTRVVIDLSAAAIIEGEDGRRGGELGLTLRTTEVGGIYGRGGHLWGPQGGFTWSVGVQTASPLSTGLLLVGVLIAYALESSYDSLQTGSMN